MRGSFAPQDKFENSRTGQSPSPQTLGAQHSEKMSVLASEQGYTNTIVHKIRLSLSCWPVQNSPCKKYWVFKYHLALKIGWLQPGTGKWMKQMISKYKIKSPNAQLSLDETIIFHQMPTFNFPLLSTTKKCLPQMQNIFSGCSKLSNPLQTSSPFIFTAYFPKKSQQKVYTMNIEQSSEGKK